MNAVYTLVLVCLLSEKCLSANIDDSCASNSACSVSNSECVKDFSNCDNGKCKCKSGYTSNSGKTACLKDTALDATCSSTTFCLYGATCDSGTSKCKCGSTQEYNSLLKLCVTTGQKAVSQECTQATDCYGNSGGMVECVVKSGSSSTTKYCTCKAGHVTDSATCRKPHASEACTTTVGCVNHISLGSGQGQETETCDSTSNKCTCPSTADQTSRKSGDMTYQLCLTKYSSKKSDGDTCTSSHQCTSTYCDSCPGGTDKKCLAPVTTDSSAMAMTGSLVPLLMAICVTVFMF